MSIEEYAKLVQSLQQTLQQLQETVAALRADLAKRDGELAELRRMLFGKRRERMPPIEREIAKKSADPEARKEKARQRRVAAAQRKRELPEVEIIHPVDPEREKCLGCDGPFRDLGAGEASFEIEYVPARFVRRRHVRQKRVCRCGDTIVVGEAPNRVADAVLYGPGLHAHCVVSKCADALPLYRQGKRLQREGVDISDSTLGDMFHRVAQTCRPIYDLIIDDIAKSGSVNADETPIKVQAAGKTRRAYIWTFIGAGHVAFRYSAGRGGDVPAKLLGAYTGLLQVDAYGGYNKVCAPEGWTRVGCLAHVRRYFFNAQETSPEAAQEALSRILAIYQVEYEAERTKIVSTDAHRTLRHQKARPLLDALHVWLLDQQGRHPPKGPMGKAITYALTAWPTLLVYLDHPDLRPDNNIAERALRAVALGRKNFMFVGNDDAGENLAVLQTLVATCHAHDVNPQTYLTDVLIRIQTHRASLIRDLLPGPWKMLFGG